MDDDIIGSVDESVVLPQAPVADTGRPLTWTEVAALIQALSPTIRARPAVVYVADRVPASTAYVLTFLNAHGEAQTAILPI